MLINNFFFNFLGVQLYFDVLVMFKLKNINKIVKKLTSLNLHRFLHQINSISTRDVTNTSKVFEYNEYRIHSEYIIVFYLRFYFFDLFDIYCIRMKILT